MMCAGCMLGVINRRVCDACRDTLRVSISRGTDSSLPRIGWRHGCTCLKEVLSSGKKKNYAFYQLVVVLDSALLTKKV